MRSSNQLSDNVRRTIVTTLLAIAPAVLGATSYTILTTSDGAVIDGNCTLREALRAADTNSAVDGCPAGGAADTITLPTGTYAFFGGEYLWGAGSLTIQSQTLDPFDVTIDLSNIGRFLALQGTGSYTLGGLAIVNGMAPAAEAVGGAIVAESVSLLIFNFRFVSNDADGSGGALFFNSGVAGASLVTHNGAFLSNSVTGSGVNSANGGAAYVSVANGAAADLRDVVFLGNSAAESTFPIGGGALYIGADQSGSVARCVRCNFQSNVANSTAVSDSSGAEGGAVFAAAYNGARIDLLDGRFSGNSATGFATASKVPVLRGFVATGGSLVLERLLVDFNSGAGDDMTRDVVLGNYGAASRISFLDSQLTFGSNSGLQIETNSVVLLGHLTIADYPAGFGAMLNAGAGEISLENSILALNGTDLIASGSVPQTTDFVGGDPLFFNEPGGDYHLSAASPSINAGTNGVPSLRLADLDHHGRIVGGVTDIGSYEFDGLFADNFEVGDAGSWSVIAP